MSFLFGSVVFFSGSIASLMFLGPTIGGLLGIVVSFLFGASIGKK
jgi:hypothetical protein